MTEEEKHKPLPKSRARHKKPKGIFCLEGDWWGKLETPSSVEPVLDLLNQWEPYHVPYIRRDVATRAELEYYLNKWAQKKYKDYPILYLGFHGEVDTILLGDGRRKEEKVSLDDIAAILEGRCRGRIIHFGSCDTLNQHGQLIRRFRKRTDALAVSGFRCAVDWMDSAIFELIVFGTIQELSLTKRGVAAMQKRIKAHSPRLYRVLGFHMVSS